MRKLPYELVWYQSENKDMTNVTEKSDKNYWLMTGHPSTLTVYRIVY